MIAHYRVKALTGFGLSLVALVYGMTRLSSLQGVLFIMLCAPALFLLGCYAYAKGKGHHGAWGLLGLLNLLGLSILTFFPDRHPARPDDHQAAAPPSTLRRGARLCLIALLVAVALAFVGFPFLRVFLTPGVLQRAPAGFLWRMAGVVLATSGFLALVIVPGVLFSTGRVAIRFGVKFACLAVVVVFSSMIALSVSRSGFREFYDPQAAIGLMFAPLLAWQIWLAAFPVGVGGGLFVLGARRARRKAPDTPRQEAYFCMGAGAVILAILGVSYFPYCSQVFRYTRFEMTARSPRATEGALRKVYAYTSTTTEAHQLLMNLAENPATPPDILRALGQHQYTSVRGRVARNPKTPLDVLRAFAADQDWSIRADLAWNPSVPTDVLDRLAKDTNETVRAAAYRHQPSARHPDVSPLLRLADNYTTSPDLLRTLGQHEYSNVRFRVAGNPNTPVDVLRKLATDQDVTVRVWVAHNPSVPDDILSRLAEDTDPTVRAAAVRNRHQRSARRPDESQTGDAR